MASSTPLRTRTKSSSESVATCKEVKYSLNFSTFNCLRWWQLMMTTSPPLKLTKWWNDYYEMNSAQKKNSLEVQQAAQECQVNGQWESWKHVVHFSSYSRCSKSWHSENYVHDQKICFTWILGNVLRRLNVGDSLSLVLEPKMFSIKINEHFQNNTQNKPYDA